MIVDVHGHFTTAPAEHQDWRAAQLAAAAEGRPAPPPPDIGDDALREAVEPSQLARMDERGVDLTVFSPRASAMDHHHGSPAANRVWARLCNDLIARVAGLFPGRFAGVAQLPQSVEGAPADCVDELYRCVTELGFVGANLNPDPSGGHWVGPPMTDRSWYPLYEALVDLDVPAMVHVSGSDNPNFHATGAHYLNADTSVFMQLVTGDLFADFPTLRLVIPHGGGAVPYHWGRYRGLARKLGRPDLDAHLLGNVLFDTCVYHQPGIDLLTAVMPTGNLLFASETFGAVDGADPDTGFAFDDTRRYLDASALSPDQLDLVYAGNARRVYPRLATLLDDA